MQPMRQVNPEVYYAEGPLVTFGRDEVEFLRARAAENERRRSRLCTHPNPEALLHEMMIVHHRSCYVRPHAHDAKAESLWVIEGAARVVFFDNNGAPSEVVSLAASGADSRYYRVPSGVHHTLLIDSEWLVFHETTTGPFKREETLFAPWAPTGDDAEAAAAYVTDLRKRIEAR